VLLLVLLLPSLLLQKLKVSSSSGLAAVDGCACELEKRDLGKSVTLDVA
jgi:hypothetical protein